MGGVSCLGITVLTMMLSELFTAIELIYAIIISSS